MNKKYQIQSPIEQIAEEIRLDDLKINMMRERNLHRKSVLGQMIAEERKRKGLTQRSAAPVLKANGVMPSNIVAIEKPSARRSHSVITMMRAYRAFETLPHTDQ